MKLNKSKQYVFRFGSDNQHRLYWDGSKWRYDFIAGGVVFDELSTEHEEDLPKLISVHGLHLEQFEEDSGAGQAFRDQVDHHIQKMEELGIPPCPKHGLSARTEDGSCEACENPDHFDDMKGTEG